MDGGEEEQSPTLSSGWRAKVDTQLTKTQSHSVRNQTDKYPSDIAEDVAGCCNSGTLDCLHFSRVLSQKGLTIGFPTHLDHPLGVWLLRGRGRRDPLFQLYRKSRLLRHEGTIQGMVREKAIWLVVNVCVCSSHSLLHERLDEQSVFGHSLLK